MGRRRSQRRCWLLHSYLVPHADDAAADDVGAEAAAVHQPLLHLLVGQAGQVVAGLVPVLVVPLQRLDRLKLDERDLAARPRRLGVVAVAAEVAVALKALPGDGADLLDGDGRLTGDPP